MTKRFGLLHHPNIAEAERLAGEAAARLRTLGVTVWRASSYDQEEVVRGARDSDLLMSFGGDGTIVRVARTIAGLNVPILSINLGRVGFLAELQPAEVLDRLEALAGGRFWVEEHMMLRAELQRGERVIEAFEALNDVVVSRGCLARVVRIAVHVDGQYLATYAADGVIVASPTGSTAYSLAAGGPVLDPQLSNLVLTPVAPHLASGTALVLPATAHVQLELSAGCDATLTADGQVDVPLQDNDVVVVTASSNLCRFVRMGERNYFYKTLLQKLK